MTPDQTSAPAGAAPAASDDAEAVASGLDERGAHEGPSPRRQAVRNAVEWVLILGVALLVAGLARAFVLQAFYIPSASMVPRLEVGDRVLVNKLSYRFGDIERGDLVVFDRPACDQADPDIQDLIKRVVALPGEVVEGRDGAVFIDGTRLDEPYLPAGVTTSTFDPYKVPDGHVWVMGDNRSNSKDSRILCGGPTPIDEHTIQGRAFVIIWPLSSISRL